MIAITVLLATCLPNVGPTESMLTEPARTP
jgi:hypothetical protein